MNPLDDIQHAHSITVIKLFNVIQQSQAASATAQESLKAHRGSGKPTLPAPSLAKSKGKKKEKQGGKTLGWPADGEWPLRRSRYRDQTSFRSSR